MGKHSDFIKLDSSKNVIANGKMPKNCVIIAAFKELESGDGYEKFQEVTYDSLGEFNKDIADTLTMLKFSNFYMAEYCMQVYSNSLYNIFDFKNSILKIKIRLVLHGFNQDLSNLQDIFNMPV